MFFDVERDSLRVAVISAHPDDETLGAGGTIARHAKRGDEIYACIVTSAYEPDWPKESLVRIRDRVSDALEILGINDVEYLGFPTVKLNVVPSKDLNDRVSEFILKVAPDIVYAPFPGDLNTDHGIVARATAVAVRPSETKRRSLLYYETLSATEWGRVFMRSSYLPNVYVDISATLDAKLEAASIYDIEMREFPHPRSLQGIKILAGIRGLESGLGAAEAFMLAMHVS